MRKTLVCLVFAMLAAPSARAAIPTADAGSDQTFAFGDLPATVNLSGSGTDPDSGSIVGYSWTMTYKPTGSSATLADATTSTPSFTADLSGTYRVCLEVEDSASETSGTSWSSLPTAACTNIMVTSQYRELVMPAKGQRNTWTFQNGWVEVLDELAGDFDAFVASLASTTASSEGAKLIGTDAKTHLGGADTVEEALTYLDTVLTTTGPYLPLAGGSSVPMTGTIYSDASTTINGTNGINASEDGTMIRIIGGTGTAASGATAAGDGGGFTITPGTGGAASSAAAGGAGGVCTVSAGTGGAGSSGAVGGDGGDLEIKAGAGGATGGAGAGVNGQIIIGAAQTTVVQLGAASVDVNVEGDLDVKGASWAIAGTAVTSTAAEINKLDGAGATVTAANLTTLTDASNADALHTHSVPYPCSTTNWELTSTTGRTAIGHWSLSTADTWITVRCYGACASTDGDATDCAVELADDGGTPIVTLTIPDGECGDTTGNPERWDESAAVSGLSGAVQGKLNASRSAGSGTCEIAGVVCVVVP